MFLFVSKDVRVKETTKKNTASQEFPERTNVLNYFHHSFLDLQLSHFTSELVTSD